MIIGYFNSKLITPINTKCPQTCTPWWCASNFRQHYFQVTAAQNCHYMFAIVTLSLSTTQITTDTKEINIKSIWFYSNFYFVNPVTACMGFLFPGRLNLNLFAVCHILYLTNTCTNTCGYLYLQTDEIRLR